MSLSTRNPCAKPGGIHSMRLFSALSSYPTHLPKFGLLRRRSTATSNTAPVTARTSLPCAWGGSW